MLLKAGNWKNTFGFHKTECLNTFKNLHLLLCFVKDLKKNLGFFFRKKSFKRLELTMNLSSFFFFFIFPKVIPDIRN